MVVNGDECPLKRGDICHYYASMDKQQIIRAIQECAERTGLSPSTITGRAVGNSRLYQRLVDGGDVTTEIAAKLMAHIRSAQAGLPRRKRSAQA